MGGAGSFPLVTRMLGNSFGRGRAKTFAAPLSRPPAVLGSRSIPRQGGQAGRSPSPSHTGSVYFCRAATSSEHGIFDPILPKEHPPYPPMASLHSSSRGHRQAAHRGTEHHRSWSADRLQHPHPDGDLKPCDPVFFPFDPDLNDEEDLGRQPIGRPNHLPDVEDRCSRSRAGTIPVEVAPHRRRRPASSPPSSCPTRHHHLLRDRRRRHHAAATWTWRLAYRWVDALARSGPLPSRSVAEQQDYRPWDWASHRRTRPTVQPSPRPPFTVPSEASSPPRPEWTLALRPNRCFFRWKLPGGRAEGWRAGESAGSSPSVSSQGPDLLGLRGPPVAGERDPSAKQFSRVSQFAPVETMTQDARGRATTLASRSLTSSVTAHRQKAAR